MKGYWRKWYRGINSEANCYLKENVSRKRDESVFVHKLGKLKLSRLGDHLIHSIQPTRIQSGISTKQHVSENSKHRIFLLETTSEEAPDLLL